MIIPENKIEEIRSSTNIVDIISEYVPLRKRGKNFLGLCPFHTEKTPSFTVNEEKQIYHCFRCHSGGNVFKFLMEYEKISFVEAVQDLAARLGITLEYDETISQEKQSEQEIFYDINTEAARYFSGNLLNSAEGEIAREYFSKRKIKLQTIRAFGLGYSLNGWENFISFAKEKKINIEKAVQLGLIGKNSEGRLFDKFSGRIIFPIFSPNGRVVAFAGRILENREGTAKYLNSPESIIYYKGKILYGLSFAKDEIRKQDKAILVEGYMDLISLYQNGIKNVVAVSGTALTEDQVQLLSRYTKNVILLFDADTAGIKASMRSIELLLKRDMEIKIVSLPSGEDPDSFVNIYGKDKFDELVRYAQNFLEYQSGYYESQGMFNDPAKETEVIKELASQAALINDEIKRALYIKNIAKKYNLREKLFENYLTKYQSEKGKRISSETKLPINLNSFIGSMINEIGDEDDFKKEREILSLLLEGKKDIIELFFNHISPEEIKSAAHKFLINLIYHAFQNEENISPSALIQMISDENILSYVSQISFNNYNLSKYYSEDFSEKKSDLIIKKYAWDTIKKFKLKNIEKMQKKIQMDLQKGMEEPKNAMELIRNLKEERDKILNEFNYKNLLVD